MTAVQDANEGQWAKWRSVADLYHAFFTGLILTVVTRRGTADAAEFVFRVFRRQQQERFLPGLEEARARSSAAGGGGRAVSLSLQLDRRRPCRIHVRDRPQGLDPLSAAALDLARHGDLRRARRSLARDAARLARQQRRGARQSQDSASSAPSRASTARTASKAITTNTIIRSSSTSGWCSRAISKRRCSIRPLRRRCRSRAGRRPRLEKAYRNYAMEYVKTAAPVMVQLFGPEDAGYLLHLTGKLIGMQYFDEIAQRAWRTAEAARRSSRRSCARCSKRRTMSPRSASPTVRSRSGSRPGS